MLRSGRQGDAAFCYWSHGPCARCVGSAEFGYRGSGSRGGQHGKEGKSAAAATGLRSRAAPQVHLAYDISQGLAVPEGQGRIGGCCRIGNGTTLVSW